MHVRKLGRYELLRVLGKGAMGVVYEGLDPNLDRRVAIKTIMVDDLSPDAAADYEARFRVEARSAARLQHPNIVTVYDSDRDGDTAFLVMEFIEGDDLKQHLDRGERYDTAGALRLIVDLLAALDFAHRQGVVHRDVKPANLLIESGGRLKLTDFGVARISGEATRTQGSMIGTLKYMAPEQVQGQKTDGRADLFSAAIVAYHLLTGARPFDGDNDFTIIHQIIGHSPAPPSTVRPELPVAVDAVFERALAKDREDRYQTGAELSTALRRALKDVVTEGPDAATIPGTSPGLGRAATLPGSPAGHELELEYWRAVRDSVDPREMEGFLAKFPEGIYADLARRRLGRLPGGPDPDRTVLTNPSVTKPVVEPTATLPFDRSDEGNATGPAASEAPVNDAGPVAATPAAAGVAIPVKRVQGADDSTFVPPQLRRDRPPLLWIGAGAVAVFAGIALWLGRAPAPPPNGTAGPSATLQAPPPAAAIPSSPPPVAKAAPAPVPASAAAPATPTPAAPREATAAGTKTRAPVSTATGTAKGKTEPARTARQESAEAGTGRAPGERLVPPSVTCRDKVFLAHQYCVYTECQKPAYHNFPACVQLREDAKLREGSGKYGN